MRPIRNITFIRNIRDTHRNIRNIRSIKKCKRKAHKKHNKMQTQRMTHLYFSSTATAIQPTSQFSSATVWNVFFVACIIPQIHKTHKTDQSVWEDLGIVNYIRHIELIRHRNHALLQLKKSSCSASGGGGEGGVEYAITSKSVNASHCDSGGCVGGWSSV